MGGGASNAAAGDAKTSSGKTIARPQKAFTDESKMVPYEAIFEEWGLLGITLKDYNCGAWVVDLTPKAKGAGVRIGSRLISVNGSDVREKPYKEVLQAVDQADFPKKLGFKGLPEEIDTKLGKPAVIQPDGTYTVEFEEWGLLGVTFEEKNKKATVVEVTETAKKQGVVNGSELLSINDRDCVNLPFRQVLDSLAKGPWPKRIKLLAPKE